MEIVSAFLCNNIKDGAGMVSIFSWNSASQNLNFLNRFSGFWYNQVEPVSGAVISNPSTFQEFDCMLDPNAIVRSV